MLENHFEKNDSMPKQHDLGQYFTTNKELQETIFGFIKNNPKHILEPSIGRGDLVRYVQEKSPATIFHMYEIDTTIQLLTGIQKDQIIYGDFMSQSIGALYKTIIGNPPYVRTKRGNLYIDFTEKCYHLLQPGGELIFIVPSDFLKLTSAVKLLNEMMTGGTFTHIFHPNNERMFENAAIDIIVFRYCKNPALEKRVLYNGKSLYITNSDGLITFNDAPTETTAELFKDYFDVYVGIVNGREEVYKNAELGNIEVLNAENKVDKYIYIETFPSKDQRINAHLLSHKQNLITRGIRKFNEKNWFEWGAMRNITAVNSNLGKDCIYVYNLTRAPIVAFKGKVGYFGGGLLMMKPKKPVDLQKVIAYLNTDTFKKNFIFSGRFKIGHRQLCNSHIIT